MRSTRRVSASGATGDAFHVDAGDQHSIERAVDDRLARMNAAEVFAHIARKQHELAATFVLCPAWAAGARKFASPGALTALRLELARRLPRGVTRHVPEMSESSRQRSG